MKVSQQFTWLLLAGLVGPASLAAQGMEPRGTPLMTRSVREFTELERTVMKAVREGDTDAIDTLVADNFELRRSSMPGNPTPRAEWLRRSHEKPTESALIEQMAVHYHDSYAIVSFLWKRSPDPDNFVVDVWVKPGDTWKLSVRYASAAGDPQFDIPGADAEDRGIRKKAY